MAVAIGDKMSQEEATLAVIELGEVDGKEHMIVLSPTPDRRVTLVKQGEETKVSLKDDMHSKGVFLPGGSIIHNHPIPVSLSDTDISFASQFNCGIFAVDSDGGRYFSSGWHDLEKAEMYVALMQLHVKPSFDMLITKKGWKEEEVGMIWSHYLNLCYRASKAVRSYLFILGEGQKKLLDRAAADLRELGFKTLADLHQLR